MIQRFVIMFLLVAVMSLLRGQETTGTIQGTVLDNNKEAIGFATVKLTDLETGYTSGTISGKNGFYVVQNLVPSRYELTISFLGYRDHISQTQIDLGSVTVKNVTLINEDLTLSEITVKAERGENFGSERSLSERRIEETPTIFRSIQELSRAIPENNLNSFAGASHRFNNLNIDGVATNDVIGFQEPASGAAGSQANGTPGSLAKSQPIGLGAIKQLSVKMSPFDVAIGNFNGANIDIITKNGTNDFRHSLFTYGNNQTTFGKYVDGVEQTKEDFYDYQFGFNTGGPIRKDKAFFFANVEYTRSSTPLTSRPGSPESNISAEDVALVKNHLIENYNYDPGEDSDGETGTQSTKTFLRFDFKLNDKNTLIVRNNFVRGYSDNLEWNANFFNFGNQGFRHNSTANSTVLELKTNAGKIYNKLNIGYNTVNEGRSFDGRIFPHLQIATSSSTRIFAGTYREASVFNTSFSTFQLTDKLSYVLDNHSLSAGIQLQLNDVDYGFLSAWNGRWEYKSVADFLKDSPARVRGVYNVNPANNTFDYVQDNPSATIGVLESALYLQDKWNINNALELTMGLRADAQFLTQKLPLSDLVKADPNFDRFTNTLKNNIQLNPRLGFVYRLEEAGINFRGGTGIFSGKLPYLWFGYMEYISGTEYFNIDIRPTEQLPLTENLGDLAQVQPGITEINLLDPDFKFPRDWKTNIGFDFELDEKVSFGAEFSYTDVIQGLYFQTLNRTPRFSQYEGADTRQYYDPMGESAKVNENFTNVFMLTNTDQGYRYNFSLNGTYKSKAWYSYIGYNYGLSKDVSSTVRSSPAANYEWNQALFGNDPELSFSNYDLRHKIIVSQAIQHSFGKSVGSVSFLYNGRSGSPFSFVYQGDLNRDGSSRNDLIFVPQDLSQISLVDIEDANGVVTTGAEQWENLNEYIENSDYLKSRRGDYVERNGAKTPWNHQMDMKVSWSKSVFGGKNLTLSLDVFNVFNLVNKNWGRLVYVPNVVNSSFSLLKFEGVENGVPQYSFNIPSDQTPWVVDTVNSRWRMQLGIKFDF